MSVHFNVYVCIYIYERKPVIPKLAYFLIHESMCFFPSYHCLLFLWWFIQMFRSFLMLKSKKRARTVTTERWNQWLPNKCNNYTTWKKFNIRHIFFSSWCIANFVLKYSPQIYPFHRSYLNRDKGLSKIKSEGQRGKKIYCLLFVCFLLALHFEGDLNCTNLRSLAPL